MKQLFTVITVIYSLFTEAFGQDTLEYYNRGVEKAMEGKYDQAIILFTRAVEAHPNHPIIFKAWYNLGLCKVSQKNYQMALADFDKAIEKKTDYFLAINMRGVCKKNLKDYEGAIKEYSYILHADSNYSDALQNRAEAYRLNDQMDQACSDWRRASGLGIVNATHAFNEFCVKSEEDNVGVITRLNTISENPQYGFSKEYPVKVGSFTGGGPQSQEAYFDLLRDQQGKKIRYRRIGSCCTYETENGFMGLGKLDIYEITYSNPKGKVKTNKVYITFYDYEEPKVLFGLKTKTN